MTKPGQEQRAKASALEQVLEAETAAAARIAAARAEAADIVSAAKQAARAEADRIDRRIQALRLCQSRTLEVRGADMARPQEAALANESRDLPDAAIDRLVDRLARRLTGQAG